MIDYLDRSKVFDRGDACVYFGVSIDGDYKNWIPKVQKSRRTPQIDEDSLLSKKSIKIVQEDESWAFKTSYLDMSNKHSSDEDQNSFGGISGMLCWIR